MYATAGVVGAGGIAFLLYKYYNARQRSSQVVRKDPKSSHADHTQQHEAAQKAAEALLTSREGWSDLHIACFNRDYDRVVDLITNAGAKVNSETLPEKWTPLQIATTKPGNERLVEFLISKGADTNAQNISGYTPLIISACNGFDSYIDMLLPETAPQGFIKANTDLRTAKTRETALHFAARNGHELIARKLVERAGPDAQHVSLANMNGALPLHSACLGGHISLVKYLLTATKWLARRNNNNSNNSNNNNNSSESTSNNSNNNNEWQFNETDIDREVIDYRKRDGCTVLHIVAGRGCVELVKLFIGLGCDLNPKSKFGTTPLHEAAAGGIADVVELLLTKRADVTVTDNDGLTPLHSASACSRWRYPSSTDDCRPKPDYTKCVELLLEFGADVNAKDTGDGTPLHMAACGKEGAVPVVKRLLESGANLSLETMQGWTALHIAHSEEGCPAIVHEIEEHIHNDFMSTFVKDKPKNLSAKRQVALRKDIFPPNGVPSLQAVADKILSGVCRNIIVLTGAGISVSAGIPDFRSPSSGIYSDPALKSLPSPSAAFDANYIIVNPQPFFALVKKLFMPVVNKEIKPTAVHYFLKLLSDKQLLLRNYTQNIDTLERIAGVPGDLMVEAHGSFASCRCALCNSKGEISVFWESLSQDKTPRCEKCPTGFLRPDVVFFGESLPGRFSDLRTDDLKKCDLLIVIGTSLTVYPVAGLVSEVTDSTPRVLFNRDPVGAFKSAVENPASNFRDVAVLGECDAGVIEFAKLLGWESELAALMTSAAATPSTSA